MTTPMVVAVRVRWGDCDPAGIAFYPRFFEWIDIAATDLHKLLGIERKGRESIHGLPLVEVEAEFLAPVLVEDSLEIRAWVVAVGRTSIGLRYEFVRVPNGTLVARATERRVYITRDVAGALRPCELTLQMRAAIEPHFERSKTAIA